MIIDKPTENSLLQKITEYFQKNPSDFIILCGQDAPVDYLKLISLLNEAGIRFCGGIFPSVIYNDSSFSDKVIVLAVAFDYDPVFVFGLDDGKIEVPPLVDLNHSSSIFILADGLSNWISKFTYELYREIGSDYQVFGSGAGFGNFDRKNCLFSHEGFHMDAAIVVSTKNQIKQSIRHGWKAIAGPYIATKTSANLLEQINWKAASNIYKNIVKEQEEVDLNNDNYHSYAQKYPFGVFRKNGEYLIRDPIALEGEDAIRFGAEIPLNSVLYLMTSTKEDILLAGKEACEEVVKNSNKPSLLFVVDCLTRTTILGEEFSRELETFGKTANETKVPVYGVFSMGEISSAYGGLLDYHHKTIVVSIIETNER